MKRLYSRRKFIYNALSATAFFGAGLTIYCCDSKKVNRTDQENTATVDSCDDLSGVSKAEIEKREALGYIEESPVPDNECNNCNLYIPPGEGKSCGRCMLFEGPVFENAYCTYWAPQV